MMAKSEQLTLAGADCGQIRLAELSVYNWGSFHQLHTAVIDPLGTLVTGDNGSGKSTLIDGLMALLLPAGKASFNIAAAQGIAPIVRWCPICAVVSARSMTEPKRGSKASVKGQCLPH